MSDNGNALMADPQTGEIVESDASEIVIIQPGDLDTADRILGYLGELNNTLADTYDVADVLVIKDRTDAIRFLTQKKGLDQAVKNRAAESQIKTLVRLSELLDEQPKQNGGHAMRARSQSATEVSPDAGSQTAAPSTYAELGIDKREAHRWRMLRLAGPKVDEFIEQANASESELTVGGAIAYSTNHVKKHDPDIEFYTPAWLVSRIRAALGGGIDLDPASCAEAQETVRAGRFLTIDEDGLTRPWKAETVFVNPPYGRAHNQVWAEKIASEFQAGNANQIASLLPASPGSEWFRLFAEHPRCFLHGRVSFWGPAETKYGGGSFDSVVIGLGVDVDRLGRAFEGVGDTYMRWTR